MQQLVPALAAAALIGACAIEPSHPLYTSFGVAGSFGYAEHQLADRVYQVSYHAPSLWTRTYGRAARRRLADRQVALAYDLALWRAAEVALINGFPAFDITARGNDVQFDVKPDYFYDPFFYPGPFLGHGHFRRYRFIGQDYYSELAVRVDLTVRVTDRPSDQAFNAERTVARLRAKYPDAAGGAQPEG